MVGATEGEVDGHTWAIGATLGSVEGAWVGLLDGPAVGATVG
jgi:hypothetical protein